MRYLLRAIPVGGLGFAVSLLIAACGGGGAGLLSSDQANTLSSQLNQVSSALATGDCAGVANATNALNDSVGSLPATVNVTLRNNLIQGASTVSELAQKDCHATTSAPAAPTTPTQTDTAPTTTATTTVPSTPTTSTSPTTTPTTPSTPTTSTSPATTPTTPGTTSSGGTGGAGLGAGGSGGSGRPGGAAGIGATDVGKSG
jgi:hypothetical protein